MHTRVNNTYTSYIYDTCVCARGRPRETAVNVFDTRRDVSDRLTRQKLRTARESERNKNCFEKVKTLTDPLQTLRTRQSVRRLQLRSTFRRPLCRIPANVLNPLIIIFVRVAYTFNVIPATRRYIYLLYIYILMHVWYRISGMDVLTIAARLETRGLNPPHNFMMKISRSI